MRFRFPNFDNFSFWLGVVLTSLVWWVISMLRPAFQQMRANARLKQAAKEGKGTRFQPGRGTLPAKRFAPGPGIASGCSAFLVGRNP